MENNEIAANGMISENTENTENTENKCAEKTNGVAGPGRNAYDVLNERGFIKPIVRLGGGTAMIADPSGKT